MSIDDGRDFPQSDRMQGRHQYGLDLAHAIEARWQARWYDERADEVPNPSGALQPGFEAVADRPRLAVLHAMPYPKPGAMHVGLAVGFVATDAYARYKRMTGHQVLQALAIDAFGLPAELHALETGESPDAYTQRNAAAVRAELRALGIGFDRRREILTTDPDYCRWTQTVFLKLYGHWFDDAVQRARPIEELVEELEAGVRVVPGRPGIEWKALSGKEQRAVLDRHRLVYPAEEPVSWCPELGRVLAGAEIAADGSSRVGGHEVVHAQMPQWVVRMSAYARRLVEDLDELDWPLDIRNAQRQWIGLRNAVAWEVEIADSSGTLTVVAPSDADPAEFNSVAVSASDATIDAIVPLSWPSDAHLAQRVAIDWREDEFATPADALRALRDSLPPAGTLTGERGGRRAFTGLFAINPVAGHLMPVFALAAAFAGRPVTPTFGTDADATPLHRNDASSSTRPSTEPTHTSRLRDWIFTRQRYWGDPVPMVRADDDGPIPVPEAVLPLRTPPREGWPPLADLVGPLPTAPLGIHDDWSASDIGRRDPNVLTQWIGSCLCHVRMLDPGDSTRLVADDIADYWLADAGGVDTYINGHAHAVGHLLYLRFLHKVLFDMGMVPVGEPVRRLVDLGRVTAGDGKKAQAMSAKRGNAVYPEEAAAAHGADALRVHLMWMGKLGTERRWADEGLVAAQRLLARLWRTVVDEDTGLAKVSDGKVDPASSKHISDAARRIGQALGDIRLSVAVSELAGLVKELRRVAASGGGLPRTAAEDLVRLAAPFAPHLAEELWSRLGHDQSVFSTSFPEGD